MNGEAAEPLTVLESRDKQSTSPQNSRRGGSQASAYRSKSLSETMDMRTPPRLPTEQYTRVSKSPSLGSCRSDCSFDDEDDTKRLLPKDVSEDDGNYRESNDPRSVGTAGRLVERQDTQFSCDGPKIERQATEFSCYVPTRRSTVAGKNGPMQFYIPSRGSEKGDAWFPRLVLQDKDPKTAQYTASAIKPVITSLGLKMKDVKLHSPVTLPESLEQQASEQAEQTPPREETDGPADTSETVLRLVRRSTEFSCDSPPLERQGTSRTRRSTRSASVSSVPHLSKTLEVQPRIERKDTEFSCYGSDPSESQISSRAETQFLRVETDFSDYPRRRFSRPSESGPGRKDRLHVDSKSLSNEFPSVNGPAVERAAAIPIVEAAMTVTKNHKKAQYQPATPNFTDSSFPVTAQLEDVIEDFFTEATPFLPSPHTMDVARRVSFQVPSNDITVKTDLSQNSSKLKSTEGGYTESAHLKQDSSATLRESSEFLQPDTLVSQTSPPTKLSGLDTKVDLVSVPEQTPQAMMPTRIPSKKDSTIRSINKKDKSLKGSKDLRNVSSDSALRETAKAPSLFSILKKSVATSQVTKNTEIPPSLSSDVSNRESNVSASKFFATTKDGKAKATSLRSGSSKNSGAARHALLSASITASRPIDMGLPTPPMLSPDIAAAPGVGSGLESLAVALKHTESVSPTGMPNVASLPMHRPSTHGRFDFEETAAQKPAERKFPTVSTTMIKSGTAQSVNPSLEFQELQLNATIDKPFEQIAQESVKVLISDAEQVIDSILHYHANQDSQPVESSSGLASRDGTAKQLDPLPEKSLSQAAFDKETELASAINLPTNMPLSERPLDSTILGKSSTTVDTTALLLGPDIEVKISTASETKSAAAKDSPLSGSHNESVLGSSETLGLNPETDAEITTAAGLRETTAVEGPTLPKSHSKPVSNAFGSQQNEPNSAVNFEIGTRRFPSLSSTSNSEPQLLEGVGTGSLSVRILIPGNRILTREQATDLPSHSQKTSGLDAEKSSHSGASQIQQSLETTDVSLLRYNTPLMNWNDSHSKFQTGHNPISVREDDEASVMLDASRSDIGATAAPLPKTTGKTTVAGRDTFQDQIKPTSSPLSPSIGNTPSVSRKGSLQHNKHAHASLRAPERNTPEAEQTSVDRASPDMNIEYWGFVPAVEKNKQDVIDSAVQGAFQDAVRKVVEDATLPATISPGEMSTAYRTLIADSLDEAVKTANEYLRRSSQNDSSLPSDLRNVQTPEAVLEDVFIGSRNVPGTMEDDDMQEDKFHNISSDQRATVNLLPERQFSPDNNVVVHSVPDSRSYTPSQYSGNRSRQDSDPTMHIGDSKIALESYEKLTSQHSELPDDPVGETGSVLWKAWKALYGARRSSYAAIPTRISSFEGQMTRTSTSKVSPTQISRATTARRNLSLGSIKERPRESGSFDLDKDDEPAAEDVKGDVNSVTKPAPTIKRRRTANWLREMLSSSAEPYETRLTALPPRTERDRLIRRLSEIAPAKPVEELLGTTSRPILPTDQLELEAMKVFSETVVDVEQLLSEALVIARQAVENGKADVIPVLENAATVLRNGRPDLNALPENDKRMETGSIHESDRSTYSEDRFSIGEDSDDEDREEFHRLRPEDEVDGRNRVVQLESGPTPTKSWAGWPPTGRAATPFPPRSILESTPSIEPRDGDINGVQAQEAQLGISSKPAEKNPVVDVTKTRLEETAERPSTFVRHGSVRDARVRLSKDRDQPEVSSEDSQDLDVFVEHDRPSHEENYEDRKESFPKPPRAPSGREGRPRTLPNKREVRNFIKEYSQPPIAPRNSSLKLRAMVQAAERAHSAYTIPARTKPIRTTTIRVGTRKPKGRAVAWEEFKAPEVSNPGQSPVSSAQLSLDGPPEEEIDLGVPQKPVKQPEVLVEIRRRTGGSQLGRPEGSRQTARGEGHEGIPEEKAIESYELRDMPLGQQLPTTRRKERNRNLEELNLRGRSHVSLKEHHKFSLGRSKKRQPIARDWSKGRKRFVALVNCISTALIGTLIGIYAGEVPSIQYYIADLHHYSILGNVFLFIGIAIPTFFFWPLPLLHGRKPYILASMSIAMPLLFPQAAVISSIRSPYVAYWRVGLLLPRALMGFVLGFANMNFQATLLDLFGASLRSGNPHGEDIDEFDVRRHGGGMGAWLGLWTWCYIGSIGIGFTVGAIFINYIAPSWGMYISIIILLFISVLNIFTPEVRRGAYRRSVAEVKTAEGISRRVARGEVMMHRVQTGPKWFGQELYHGVMLSLDMIKQPGFLVLTVYQAWIYGQVVLMIVLLGSLMSNSYRFKSPLVGASVAAIPLGAMLAIPFERASLFSRSRTQKGRTNSNTFDTKISWKSHIVRRAIFTSLLPIMGIGYTATSSGPPIPWILPILFAAAFGFLSNMTIAECVGIIMETWDTSDLQPGMTGRPRRNSGEDSSNKRTNYSSFPRVASAFAITQGLGFLIAAVATGIGGVATRHLGQQVATGVMAGILIILTLLFFAVLVRWQDVQIIPNAKTAEMDLYVAQRRLTAMRPPGAPEVEEPWRPIIIGNPHSKTRRMSIIELGSMTRWSEIRRKNRLYDETVLHPDREVLHQAHLRLQEKQQFVVRSVHGSLRSAHGSLRGRLSRQVSGEGSGTKVSGARRSKGMERRREVDSEGDKE